MRSFVSRHLLLVSIVLALLGTEAIGQQPPERGQKPPPRPEEMRPKVDEKAYKAALERIPVPKEKYDPWGLARPSEPKKSKAK